VRASSQQVLLGADEAVGAGEHRPRARAAGQDDGTARDHVTDHLGHGRRHVTGAEARQHDAVVAVAGDQAEKVPPIAEVGLQQGDAGDAPADGEREGRPARGSSGKRHRALVHAADRAERPGTEGVQGNGVGLAHAGGGVHLVVEHHQRSPVPGIGTRGHDGRRQQVRRSVGTCGRRRAHGAGHHQRLRAVPVQVEQVRGLLDGVRPLDHHDPVDAAVHHLAARPLPHGHDVGRREPGAGLGPQRGDGQRGDLVEPRDGGDEVGRLQRRGHGTPAGRRRHRDRAAERRDGHQSSADLSSHPSTPRPSAAGPAGAHRTAHPATVPRSTHP
jgi:hypothetical protein